MSTQPTEPRYTLMTLEPKTPDKSCFASLHRADFRSKDGENRLFSVWPGLVIDYSKDGDAEMVKTCRAFLYDVNNLDAKALAKHYLHDRKKGIEKYNLEKTEFRTFAHSVEDWRSTFEHNFTSEWAVPHPDYQRVTDNGDGTYRDVNSIGDLDDRTMLVFKDETDGTEESEHHPAVDGYSYNLLNVFDAGQWMRREFTQAPTTVKDEPTEALIDRSVFGWHNVRRMALADNTGTRFPRISLAELDTDTIE